MGVWADPILRGWQLVRVPRGAGPGLSYCIFGTPAFQSGVIVCMRRGRLDLAIPAAAFFDASEELALFLDQIDKAQSR
jgi:hypothetical protein